MTPPSFSTPGGTAAEAPPKRRVLLVNLDFRDVVYSHLWGRAVLDGCTRHGFAVDMVAVNPAARRDVAGELGVPSSALDVQIEDGTAVYIDNPDESQCRTAIGRLIARSWYHTLILNAEARLFTHLMVDRQSELANTLWVIYDRHLHIGLPAPEESGPLHDRIAASDIHLYTIQEIATHTEASVPQDGIIGTFKRLGLASDRIHLQQWPIDDEFFAAQPAPATPPFVIFSGGDSGRDYVTLFEAVRGLPVELRLCAGNYPTPVPSNVTILPRLRLHEFRDEVARATVVVVPLSGDPPVSGITVIAMAKMMQKPIIASDIPIVRMHIRSQGDGGYLTQTGNPALLRLLLTGLIESSAERERLGREAHAQALRDLSLRGFVDRMFTRQ